MSRLTISQRIAVGFGVLLAVLVAVSGLNLWKLSRIAVQTAQIADRRMPAAALVTDLETDVLNIQIDTLRHLLSKTAEDRTHWRTAISARRDRISGHIARLDTLLESGRERDALARAVEARSVYVAARNSVLDMQEAEQFEEASVANVQSLRPAFEAYNLALAELGDLNTAATAAAVVSLRADTETSRRLTVIVSLVGGLAGIVFAWIVVRAINRVLRATTDTLISGAAEIVAASGQVSGASQSLAAGAAKQAASLEETGASIEELSGMTKRNSGGAGQARALAQTARHAADTGAGSVAQLNTAMADLTDSSAEVAKIVKTIDEIAFQTNILALNAAVEAARAGEAGLGFAVVAEEVRSLAQRSALAAKETAGKIETALAKSEDGARISREVSQSLGVIVEQVRQLDDLVGGIASASQQQTRGIDQVNSAVGQIDTITQANAAAAEEAAAAAEELNAQASELNTLVGKLLALVGGQRARDRSGRPGAPRPGGMRRGDPDPGAPAQPRETLVAAARAWFK